MSKSGRTVQRFPLFAAGIVFLVHALGNAHYGFFRDELYFIICGRHPQLGYVDQPPMVPLLAALTQAFGPSLFLLRLVPAIFAAAAAYTTCLLVMELYGGVFAQLLATLTVFFANVLQSFGTKLSPDTIGLWTWPLIALFILRLTKGADQRLWLVIGLIAGLSIESKYSILFFLFAIVAGLLLTRERGILFNRWALLGALMAGVIALPNFLWQLHYGLPMLELLKNGQLGKNLIVGPLQYLAQEVLITGALLAAVWIIGLIWLLAIPQLRFLGFTYIMLIIAMLFFHGKHYYPADVYPILFAAGAVTIERWTNRQMAVRFAIVTTTVVWGIVILPQTMPVLSEAQFVRYDMAFRNAIGVSRNATATEANREASALPGDWADMHGWPELVRAVARVYDSLPPVDRVQAVIFAGNFGEAAALNFFEPRLPVISGHNQYWLWGTHGYGGNIMVQVGGSCFESDHLFASRTLATTFRNRWASELENARPIRICRRIRKPLSEVWPEIKTYL